MKLSFCFVSFSAFAVAQKPLVEQVALAESKCTYFMEKAFDCDPPKSKIGKYQFRIKKILRDAVHHQSKGKCVEKKKRVRRDVFDDLEAEFVQIEQELESDGFSGKTSDRKVKPSGKLQYVPVKRKVQRSTF